MVRIRLQRHGRKKKPYYHIVAADIRKKRDGGIIDDLGRYNPVANPKTISLETDRVIYWLQNGAQPSEAVKGLLKAEGIYYRLHLIRWGKSAEEIEQTVADWKAGKGEEKTLSRVEIKRAALKAEQEQVSVARAEAAATKAAEEAAAAAKAAEAADAAKATEAAAAAKAAEEAGAQSVAEEVASAAPAEAAPAEAAPASAAPAEASTEE
ncbi:MAG: 30S ribosomal protein S16 [Bacteroidetes bacterium]|nr:30S ribosomal protein S16 [Bacteroidota bacterium]